MVQPKCFCKIDSVALTSKIARSLSFIRLQLTFIFFVLQDRFEDLHLRFREGEDWCRIYSEPAAGNDSYNFYYGIVKFIS